MQRIDLWQYTVWLVAIRYLLPISIVVLLTLTGIDLTNIGIPVLSAILAAAIAGRGVARSKGHMPGWREVLAFAVLATLIFLVVNSSAYFLLALSNIGPVSMYILHFWYITDHTVDLMAFLTTVAFISNAVVFPFCIKAELRAIAKSNQKEQDQ
ncbi:ABZJ_00895 family protein [Ruegeria halocynthiae]|uniref:ABZJ_00895 family protein n=1 Tax=Ruegeria halocynthiae TaxID=985054 RepID=UPI00056049A1|nr:ABZJ_00895 family protein [Ruegeria halocynthiae]